MKRKYLFELEDQKWFPATIRNAMTDWLSFSAEIADFPFKNFSSKLAKAMSSASEKTIVELGSGGGGPAIQIANIIARTESADIRLILTDLFPNIARLNQAAKKCNVPVRVFANSVDATNVPADIRGFRLMCNSFHHLSDDMALRSLSDSIAKKQGFAVMELVGRDPLSFCHVLIGISFMMIGMPFLKPFRFSRILFMYLIPIIPLAVLWDGMVSCFRVFSPEEMKDLIQKLPPNEYSWDVGVIKIKFTPLRITYLIGSPPG